MSTTIAPWTKSDLTKLLHEYLTEPEFAQVFAYPASGLLDIRLPDGTEFTISICGPKPTRQATT